MNVKAIVNTIIACRPGSPKDKTRGSERGK